MSQQYRVLCRLEARLGISRQPDLVERLLTDDDVDIDLVPVSTLIDETYRWFPQLKGTGSMDPTGIFNPVALATYGRHSCGPNVESNRISPLHVGLAGVVVAMEY